MQEPLSAAFKNSLRKNKPILPLDRALPLLDDTPCTLQGRPADVYGQKIARETLETAIIEALSHPKRDAVVVALLGRYGQGKSTVLRQLADRMAKGRPAAYYPPKVRFRSFDVAAARLDSLLFAFDAQIQNWSLRRRLAMMVIPSVMLIIAILIVYHDVYPLIVHYKIFGSKIWKSILLALGVPTALSLTILARPISSFWSFIFASVRDTADSQAWAKLRSEWNFGSYAGIRDALRDLFGGRPDVLLIDNLDRASTDQQRAFLQVIRRHRSALPRVVIVAFDETPLLLSDDKPDTPLEILSKTFTTTVRLTPELPNDVVAATLHVIVALAETDPQFLLQFAAATALKEASGVHPLNIIEYALKELRKRKDVTRHFGKPSVLGDLVRILSLHRRHSFRFCKQFINVLATRAHTLRLDHPDDVSAFIRLEGLRMHLPWILDTPETLGDLLDADSVDGLIAYAEQVARRKLNDEERQRVEKFLRATRHMRPTLRGWPDLLARPNRVKSEQRPTDLQLDPVSLVEWLVWDQHFAATDNPLGRAEAYCIALRDPLGAERPRATESIWSAEPLASIISLPEPLSAEQTQSTLCNFGALVHRIWYADPDFALQKAFLRLDPQEPFVLRKDWLPSAASAQNEAVAEAFEALRSTMLQALPAAHPDLVGTLAAATMIAASGEVRRDESMLRAWFQRLDIAPPDENGFFPQLLGQTLTSTDTAIVFRAWPAIPRASAVAGLDFDYATKICGTLGLLHRRQCRASADVLRPWLIHVAEIDDGHAAVALGVITVVAALFPRFSPGEEQAWDLCPVDWIVNLDQPVPLWNAWLKRLRLRDLRYRPDRWAIVFIAILAGADDCVERMVQELGMPPRWDLGWIAGLDAALASPNDHSGIMAGRVRRGLSGQHGCRIVASAIRAAWQSQDPIRMATARTVARACGLPEPAA